MAVSLSRSGRANAARRSNTVADEWDNTKNGGKVGARRQVRRAVRQHMRKVLPEDL